MNLSKLYKNTFLIVLLSLVLTACATQKKVATETEATTTTTETTTEETTDIKELGSQILR